MVRSFKAFLPIASLLLLAAAPLAAFTYIMNDPASWTGQKILLTLRAGDFSSGDQETKAVIQAYQAWNNVPGQKLQISYLIDDCDPDDGNDGVNCVCWQPEEQFGGGVLALTQVGALGGQIVNADIWLNEDLDWTFETDSYFDEQKPYSFQLVLLHELGHALGLGHEDAALATMNSYYPNAGPLGPDFDIAPHGDDRAGQRSLYGDGKTVKDLAASNYARAAAGRSEPISPTQHGDPGEIISFKHTVVNLGTVSVSEIRVAYYLSEDSEIDGKDTFLKSDAIDNVSAHSAKTRTVALTIPADSPDRRAYLGVVLDLDDSVVETDERNNALAATGRTVIGEGDDDEDDDDDNDDGPSTDDDDDDDSGSRGDRSSDDSGCGA